MNQDHQLISVIMPVYNGEQFIRESIDSILNQTYRNFEFIIVNDGSVDSTKQIIGSYDDKRIVLLDLPANQGVSNARNAGTDISRGEYIAFCDADDLYDPDRLRTQLDFLTGHPSIDICGSYFIVFENGQERLIRHPLTDSEIKEHFFISNCIGQPSVMGKTEVFRKYKYNPEIQASEDYDLWTRMAIGGVVLANVPYPLVKYRLHPAQASKTKAKLLYNTSNTICTNYTLAYLSNDIITRYVESKVISLADFKKFVAELSLICDKKSRDMNIFRPLIALQYKKLNKFGVGTFMTLRRTFAKYHLSFPAKYLLNVFLLCLLPINRGSSLFDTLTKLKL